MDNSRGQWRKFSDNFKHFPSINLRKAFGEPSVAAGGCNMFRHGSTSVCNMFRHGSTSVCNMFRHVSTNFAAIDGSPKPFLKLMEGECLKLSDNLWDTLILSFFRWPCYNSSLRVCQELPFLPQFIAIILLKHKSVEKKICLGPSYVLFYFIFKINAKWKLFRHKTKKFTISSHQLATNMASDFGNQAVESSIRWIGINY